MARTEIISLLFVSCFIITALASPIRPHEGLRALKERSLAFRSAFDRQNVELETGIVTMSNGTYHVFNVLDCGAVGDGIADDTAAISSCISQCAAAGSSDPSELSVVAFPSGKVFSSFPFLLESYCSLFIPTNATILANNDIDAWPLDDDDSSFLDFMRTSGSSEYISIFGGGVIDGQGYKWWYADDVLGLEPHRPNLIKIKVDQIYIEGVQLVNSPYFNVACNCTNAEIDHVTVLAPKNSPNTDGIDPNGGDNIHIHHCVIINGDDCVAVKHNTTNVLVERCFMANGHGASIGAVENNNYLISNIEFRYLTIYNTMVGPRLKTYNDGTGTVTDAVWRDIWVHSARDDAIRINMNYVDSDNPVIPTQPDSQLIEVFNIAFENILCEGIDDSDNGGELTCIEDSPCKEVYFANITMDGDYPSFRSPWECDYISGEQLNVSPTIKCLNDTSSAMPFDREDPMFPVSSPEWMAVAGITHKQREGWIAMAHAWDFDYQTRVHE